jgi:hypothetical protein
MRLFELERGGLKAGWGNEGASLFVIHINKRMKKLCSE